MRGPLAEIPEQAILAFGLGAQFENLLFPQQIEWKGSGNCKGEFFVAEVVEIFRHAGVEESVTGLVKLDQLLAFPRRGGTIIEIVLEVIHVTFQKRVFRDQIHDAERATADSDNVHATVLVTLDDFEDFRRTSHENHSIRKGKEHAEGRFGVKALADHTSIAGLENVQGKLFAGEKYDVKREERNAFRPHGSHGE